MRYFDFFNTHINFNDDNFKIIPMNWCATKYYSFTFEGWSEFSLDANDKTLKNIIKISLKCIHSFFYIYKNTHAFTEPQFHLKPNGTAIIKIGTMEIEDYMQRMGKQNITNI